MTWIERTARRRPQWPGVMMGLALGMGTAWSGASGEVGGAASAAQPAVPALLATMPPLGPVPNPVDRPASQAALPVPCAMAIRARFPAWRPLSPPAEAAAWARAHGRHPTIGQGDFDGDGTPDVATVGIAGTQHLILLCLTRKDQVVTLAEPDEGCTDLLHVHPAGSRVPNLDSGTEELLQHDTVATSCFEKSGRSFVLERDGRFRVFFHAD